MILKLILSGLELDLSTYEFSMIEENNWLNDKVSSKYTYPIDIDLTPEQNVALGHITEINLAEHDALLEGQFYAMGLCHDCVFEIERHIGKRLSGQIRYGLEEFPNFNKQLSELPLEVVKVTGSIFAYAKTIVGQTWPAVNFNFPQVITDKFDTDTEQWAYFEGIVNNYKAGNFLVNEFDAVNNVQVNRNILQPLPYLLHILTAGFADAGHVLEGEILDDPEFKRATIYALSEFYTNYSEDTMEVQMRLDESEGPFDPFGSIRYVKNIVLPGPGRYKIAGNVYHRKYFMKNSSINFKYKGNHVWSDNFRSGKIAEYKEKMVTVDFNIDYAGGFAFPLVFESDTYGAQLVGGDLIYDAPLLDVTITLLSKFDSAGNLVPTLVTPSEVNLPKCVPRMNFGEFVTAFAKWKNYGIIVSDGVVTMDKKVAEIKSGQKTVNLEAQEVKEPERNFNQAKTFTLGFFELDNKEYNFPSLFITKNGSQISPYVKNADTDDIVINALPLPLKLHGDVTTAHGFLDDDSKPQVVLYDGLTGGLNLAQNPDELNIVNVYASSHEDWFNFLLNSIRTAWSFVTPYEQIYQLKVSDIIYAYRQNHIIRRLTRKNTRPRIIETEIELESLD
ncbi:MAG TPA: hypothetical protein VLY84_00355 [Dysgonamonadaceae bacterium]|nr:hypothetical protein [Dysgonamonadaceae bacterium]